MNKSLTDYLYDVAGYHHYITTYTKIVDNKEQYYIHFLDHYFEKSMIFQKFRRLKIDLEWILKISDSIALDVEEIKADPFYGYVYQLNFDWNNTISKLNEKQIVSHLIKNKNPIIRRLIAKNGTNQHRQQLLDNNEKDLLVLCKIAEFGTYSQRRKLISILDKNDIGFVKAEILYLIDKIIEFGNEKQKQHYINHENYAVRCKVAQFGSDEQREYLMNDKSSKVLCTIIQFGNDKQRQRLINHESDDVRATIAHFGNDKQRSQLIGDKNMNVVCNIIKFGNDEHKNLTISHYSYNKYIYIVPFVNLVMKNRKSLWKLKNPIMNYARCLIGKLFMINKIQVYINVNLDFVLFWINL